MFKHPDAQGFYTELPVEVKTNPIYITKYTYNYMNAQRATNNGLSLGFQEYFSIRDAVSIESKSQDQLTVKQSIYRLANFLGRLNYYLVLKNSRYHIISGCPFFKNPKNLSLEDGVSLYNWGVYIQRKKGQLTPMYVKNLRFPTQMVFDAYSHKKDDRSLFLQRCRKSPLGLKVHDIN